jgi:hypothetical protein
VRLHHLAHLDEKVQWNASPPPVRIEHAVLDTAAEAADELTAIATLADAVQARRTTATRLLSTLDQRTRFARRPLLRSVLDDVAAGSCSALEHGYLVHVERAHRLPAARRQVRASTHGPVYRDIEHPDRQTVVELDGRPCHTAAQVARVLTARGWGRHSVALSAVRSRAIAVRRCHQVTPAYCVPDWPAGQAASKAKATKERRRRTTGGRSPHHAEARGPVRALRQAQGPWADLGAGASGLEARRQGSSQLDHREAAPISRQRKPLALVVAGGRGSSSQASKNAPRRSPLTRAARVRKSPTVALP